MNKTPRKVKFSTVYRILKKRPISISFGALFTFMPLLMLIIFSLAFSSLEADMPEVDFDLINSQGEEMEAEITNIETQYNTTINGVHPTIIYYQYHKNNMSTTSKSRVLEERKVESLTIGDNIDIQVLDGASIIKGMKPYSFPIRMISGIFIPFLIFGLPFLIYATIQLVREMKLYKSGKVVIAEVVSLMPKAGLPVSGVGQGVIVHYEYKSSAGNKILGESITSDFSIMTDKKKGDLIPVFVSSSNEGHSCVVPKLDSLRNNWGIEFV